MKKALSIIAIILLVFIVAGIGAVITERILFPRLATMEQFSNYDFIKNATDNVMIIEKTEQITVREDDSVNTVSGQAATTVVNIVSTVESQAMDIVSVKATNKNGTGMALTSDGIIATVREAIIPENASYTVFFYDGTHAQAELLGIDPYTDIALLSVDRQDLTSIAMANSDDARPGKKLIAIGHAFGEYQNRYASGLLSHLNKVYNLSGGIVSSSEKLEGVFEFDNNILVSYVGGPVVDYYGEMIGVVTKVGLNSTAEYVLIPTNDVRATLEYYITYKDFERVEFGASYLPITKEYAVAKDLPRDRGAIIYSPSGRQGLAVLAGSSAQIADLRVGDIIIAVDEQEVDLDHSLSALIAPHRSGDTIILKILRENELLSVDVVL